MKGKVHFAKKGDMYSRQNWKVYMKNNWQLYVMILPAVVFFFIFNYLPMYGIQIAFKDFRAVDGISGSQWVGLKHFTTFFNAYYFKRLLINTLVLNLENLIIGFQGYLSVYQTAIDTMDLK